MKWQNLNDTWVWHGDFLDGNFPIGRLKVIVGNCTFTDTQVQIPDNLIVTGNLDFKKSELLGHRMPVNLTVMGNIKLDIAYRFGFKAKVFGDYLFHKDGMFYEKVVDLKDPDTCYVFGERLASIHNSYSLTTRYSNAEIALATKESTYTNKGANPQIVVAGRHNKIDDKGYGRVRIASTGDEAIISSNNTAVICGVGAGTKVKAGKGSWITLAEWKGDKIVCVRTRQVDGINIKADTFYQLKDGEFYES